MDRASARTVLGNFNNAKFDYNGVKSLFFKKGDRYFVRTDGADGSIAEFEVLYTFGVYPLQQYLIELPGGRIQALGIAWDAREKKQGGQRWFHLYPKEKVTHSDILHWTRIGQNWNLMCAECHSTNVRKNFDEKSRTFATTWSEINVGCEGCHGPGSAHLAWAKEPAATRSAGTKGLVYALTHTPYRPTHDSPGGKTVGVPVSKHPVEIQTCARCHSRRSVLNEDFPFGKPLLDSHLPSLLTAGTYFPDGQIQEENYEYGSFLQSKMYASGVTCSDCHNPHSGKIKIAGNALCSQCHAASRYDSPSHHFHKAGNPGGECKSCHMPTQTYMVVDPRHDHSFRVPDPALSESVNSTDACLNCHKEKGSGWSKEWIKRWYGEKGTPPLRFGTVLHAARRGSPDATGDLQKLVGDLSKPEIVRATAVLELRQFLSPEVMTKTISKALKDTGDLVRFAAVRSLEQVPLEISAPSLLPLLNDPVLGVRIEAARVLAALSPNTLPYNTGLSMERASKEYIASQRVVSESPQAQLNLGIYFLNRGDLDAAERAYRTALVEEPEFIPAYINLADLLRVGGRDREGGDILRAALKRQPRSVDAVIALGLLYVRSGEKEKALALLRDAASFGSSDPHFVYVYVLMLRDAGRQSEADQILGVAVRSNPDDRELQSLLPTR